MCGICGIATTHGAADVETLRAMAERLAHRGPDSAGEHLDGGVALAAPCVVAIPQIPHTALP